MLENPAIVAVTGGELITLAAAVGATISDIWILPRGVIAQEPSLNNAHHRLWRFLGLYLGALTLCIGAELLLRASDMSDLPVLNVFPELGVVLLQTHYGRLWLWRGAALLLVWIAWMLQRRKDLSRPMSLTAFAALTAIATALSASGHSGDDGVLSLANIANSLHVIGGLLWGGIIIASISVIFPFLLRAKEPLRELAAAVSLRLSTLAGVALAMVLLPGIYNAWLQIGTWHGLWSTLYGRILVAKITLVSSMIVLGAINRYRYLPAIQRHAGRPEPQALFTLPRFFRVSDEATSITDFRRTLRLEGLLLLGVLTLAAALSQQTPAAHIDHEHMANHVHGDVTSDIVRPREIAPAIVVSGLGYPV